MTHAIKSLKEQKQQLERALQEETKQNEELKEKERVLKGLMEEKILTEQPSFKAFMQGSFARSSNITVNDSRFTQPGVALRGFS